MWEIPWKNKQIKPRLWVLPKSGKIIRIWETENYWIKRLNEKINENYEQELLQKISDLNEEKAIINEKLG